MNYGDEKKGGHVGPGTESVIKRSLSSNSGKTNTHGGREYKKDFAKDGTDAPADWGECLNKGGGRDY